MVNVVWNRPERVGAVQRITYRSKCGRFKIEKWEWTAPSACVSYWLYRDGERIADLDTLAEAKEAAAEFD